MSRGMQMTGPADSNTSSPSRLTEVVMSQHDYDTLRPHLLSNQGREAHAFLVAGRCRGSKRTRLLVREVVAAADDDYIVQSPSEIELKPSYFLPLVDQCRKENLSLIEVHSHPHVATGVAFSALDVANENEKFAWYKEQLPEASVATLVFGTESVDGHYWSGNRNRVSTVDAVRVIGRRLQVLHTTSSLRSGGGAAGQPEFDRQERLLGCDGQERLASARIGIVGCGGLGSLVVQQLAYLGVHQFALVDMDVVETTNLNRLVGATEADAAAASLKVDVMERMIQRIRTDAEVITVPHSVGAPEAEEALKDVDLLIAGADSDGARLLTNELAIRYLIPYMDLGTGVNVTDGRVEAAGGQFWMMVPGGFCLQCSGLIDARQARIDLMTESERRRHEARGYGVDSPQPAVIFLNATVASLAVGEVVKYLTGLDEAAAIFHYDAMAPSVEPMGPMSPNPDCVICRRDARYAIGDQESSDAWSRAVPSVSEIVNETAHEER